jgi:DNA helicase II / ATP-dependent DNA helicase PcrA
MLSDVSEEASTRFSEVVSHAGGPQLILGCAGSGKTTLIEERFCRLVDDGERPERVLVLAPSAGRADALRVRLEARLQRGYESLFVLTPAGLAAWVLGLDDGGESDLDATTLSAGDRLVMLIERIDELSVQHHDFGGRVNALFGSFVRRIDRCKAELIDAEAYAAWAAGLETGDGQAALEQEFAEVYRAHERMLADAGARDEGDLLRDGLRAAGDHPAIGRRFAHVLVDDAQELELVAARLACAVAAPGGLCLTVTADPSASLRRFRRAGEAAIAPFTSLPGLAVRRLERSERCPVQIARVAGAVLGTPMTGSAPGDGGAVTFWRATNDRAQAQAVAAEVERLLGREGVDPGDVAVLVPEISREGQAVAVALEERAVPHRLIGEAAFFQRAEIRDVLAWLRLLADPTDAAAVVRALARPPIELRSVDIARCTQIARRRKLDMVAALAAATESPQVPPEARERIRMFLKLYRSGAAAIDTTRPDLYVHRLIDRLGLRRQQLFAAQADVVERLRALARFGELASAYVRRKALATPREFARSIAAVADFGLREQEEPTMGGAGAVQVVGLDGAGGLEARHVFVLGMHAGVAVPASEPVPDALLPDAGIVPPDDEDGRERGLRQALYVGVTRARDQVVFCYPAAGDRGGDVVPLAMVEAARIALGVDWEEKEEELFGPAETLHSTYRLLRDELLEGTMRTAGRLGELRFDTDLDISHAVVRYLELLKVAALIARPDGQNVAEALRDVNSRIGQAVTAEQREIFTSSALDDYLLDAERDARRRAAAIAARDEPSLEAFLPRRGEGVVLSASDIDTYRTCPLKYKFARVFRIPQEPTVHQRFGIVVHQVLERFHSGEGDSPGGGLPELLGLLEASWRRGGFGDSEEERQLRGKAAAALIRYHERFQTEECEPVWFERQFTFKLGPHLLRGRVDRVDRLPGGEYELIDYKTGRPKTAAQLADDVQLSLYAVGAREAWELDTSHQAYYYVLDDEKVSVPLDDGDRSEWITAVAMQTAEGILSQGFEPTPSFAACSICDYRLICPAAER